MGLEPQSNVRRVSGPQGYHKRARALRDSACWLSYRGHAVTRNLLLALLAFAVFASSMPAQALAEPAVARPTIPKHAASQSSGTVFFTEVEETGAVAAIGTAHTVKISDIARAGRVEFRLGGSWDLISTSTRLLVPPGVPFNASGGTVAGDFFVYALDSAPNGVRVLQIEASSKLADLAKGDAVQILGIPTHGGDNEVVLSGEIFEASPEQIQLNLEGPFDLRGWGGAPVIATASGRVIGIVQASVSRASIPRLTVGPISAVQNALSGLRAGATGRTFAKFADTPAVQNSENAPSQRFLSLLAVPGFKVLRTTTHAFSSRSGGAMMPSGLNVLSFCARSSGVSLGSPVSTRHPSASNACLASSAIPEPLTKIRKPITILLSIQTRSGL